MILAQFPSALVPEMAAEQPLPRTYLILRSRWSSTNHSFAAVEQQQLAWLITRRSPVQVWPPQPVRAAALATISPGQLRGAVK